MTNSVNGKRPFIRFPFSCIVERDHAGVRQVLVKREAVQSTGVACGGTTDRPPSHPVFFSRASLSTSPIFVGAPLSSACFYDEPGNKFLLFSNTLVHSLLSLLSSRQNEGPCAIDERTIEFESAANSTRLTKFETRNAHLAPNYFREHR